MVTFADLPEWLKDKINDHVIFENHRKNFAPCLEFIKNHDYTCNNVKKLFAGDRGFLYRKYFYLVTNEKTFWHWDNKNNAHLLIISINTLESTLGLIFS